ncbi:CDP-alcohol phosphatidyltransferase family protein [Halomarina pelagica]|uniref:CDP-alcohol phosphatidyltransferase family protein n=1 Tax=Halomarina pelagica TaxID=2961599 RepID=UPI0020C42006|nr:CDP-alcohol phosphatidyltransferase family protein [Halomarina sp. BND7]
MSDEIGSAVRRVVTRVDRRGPRFERENVLRRLTVADYISLVALFWGWASAVLFLTGEPNWAVLAMLGGYGFDKLDGYWARRSGVSSAFGRQIDSFIDVFVYLVSAALLYHYALAPNVYASLVVGFLVVAFGGLRLVRHNDEGFIAEGGTSYYRGTTVVHTNLAAVGCYLAAAFTGIPNGWLAGALLVLVSPLMVSDYRAPKTDRSHVLAALAALTVAAGCLYLEVGA